jgi:hypothetical protein
MWLAFALVNGTIELFWRGFLLTEIAMRPRWLVTTYASALGNHPLRCSAFAPALLAFRSCGLGDHVIPTLLFEDGQLRLDRCPRPG